MVSNLVKRLKRLEKHRDFDILSKILISGEIEIGYNTVVKDLKFMTRFYIESKENDIHLVSSYVNFPEDISIEQRLINEKDNLESYFNRRDIIIRVIMVDN